MSLAVTVDTDKPAQLREHLAKQLAQVRKPRKGWRKSVLEETELDHGVLLRLQSKKDGSTSSYQEVHCAFHQPDDPYVVTLQGISWKEDADILSAITTTCHSIEILGDQVPN